MIEQVRSAAHVVADEVREEVRAVGDAIGWDGLRGDIREVTETKGRWAGIRAVAGGVATMAVMAPYLMGGVFEATMASIGGHAYNESGDPMVAGGAMGVTSGVTELVLTGALAYELGKLPHTAEALAKRQGETPVEPPAEVAEAEVGRKGLMAHLRAKLGGRKVKQNVQTVALGVSTGSPGIMLKKFADEPQAGSKAFAKAGAKTAAALAGFNTALGIGYGSMMRATAALDTISPGLSDKVVHTATSPLTWGGLFLYLSGPVQQAQRALTGAMGRGAVFRGDELGYQTLAARLEENEATLALPSSRARLASLAAEPHQLEASPHTAELCTSDQEETDQEAEPEPDLEIIPLVRPQALTFLQTIYGRDRRLDTLTQEEATRLTDRLLHEYGVYYDYDIEDLDTDPNIDEKIHHEPHTNPEYVRAVDVTARYVRGESVEQIMVTYHNLLDEIDVELTLDNVATHLRRNDELYRLSEPDYEFLEEILQHYTGPVVDARARWHIAPIGQPIIPRIEHPQSTQAWQELHEEHKQDAKAIEAQYLEKLASDAEYAVYEYAATSEFRRAAARKDHDKSGEVFIIGPGDNDEDSQVLRHMSWLVSTAVFARKDGNTLEEMQEHKNDEHDYHMLAVDQSGEYPQPMGALYTKVQSEDSLASVQDIWYEWDDPVREAMLKAGLPDLRYDPDAIDVMTVAVLPKFESGGANLILYNRLGVLCNALGIKYVVNVFDEGPAAMLNGFGNAFKSYKGHEPINYKARIPGANRSLSRYAILEDWQESLRLSEERINNRAYDNFWKPDMTLGKRYQLADVERFRTDRGRDFEPVPKKDKAKTPANTQAA